MTHSVADIFLQVVEENNIDLNSKYKLEQSFCFDKMVEKLIQCGLTKDQLERKMRTASKLVSQEFEYKKLVK